MPQPGLPPVDHPATGRAQGIGSRPSPRGQEAKTNAARMTVRWTRAPDRDASMAKQATAAHVLRVVSSGTVRTWP
jgi:hypothetical protein